jgi:hypothetical protein
MTVKKEDIENSVRWKEEYKVVFVKKSQDYMKVRSGDPTEDFWSLWREHKDDIKSMGIYVRKEEDEEEETYSWKVTQWEEPTEEEKVIAEEEWKEKMGNRRFDSADE